METPAQEEQQQEAAVAPAAEKRIEALSLDDAAGIVPAVETSESDGGTEDAKDQLIHTLSEELIKTKADLARITKEREYYKRRAEWLTTTDAKILSPVLTSADQWHDRTWLILHEPIRQALVDFEDLVMKTPSFDPVKFPWKVVNFFTFFKGAFAPYVRRHHEAEESVYLPWIRTKCADIPAAVTESHGSLEDLLKAVEQSEAEYKVLVKAKAGPEQLYEWRSTLIMRLSVLGDALRAHMDEEERHLPPLVAAHFTETQEQAVLEKMGSASTAHIELPLICFGMDVWASPSIKDAFLAQLSGPGALHAHAVLAADLQNKNGAGARVAGPGGEPPEHLHAAHVGAHAHRSGARLPPLLHPVNIHTHIVHACLHGVGFF